MHYQGQEIIKLTSAFQAIGLHEAERQRVDRTAQKKRVGNPLQSLVDELRRLFPSERRSALAQKR